MARNSENKLAYGLILMVIGLIFLFDKTGLLDQIPYGNHATSLGVLTLIAGLILMAVKSDKKWGVILTGLGVLLNADFFFGWFNNLSAITVPVVLIIIGVVLVLKAKR